MWNVLQHVVPFLLGLVIMISFTLSENANYQDLSLALLNIVAPNIFKEEDFIAALQNVPWHTAYLYEDSNDIREHWSKLYNDVLELHTPLKYKQ